MLRSSLTKIKFHSRLSACLLWGGYGSGPRGSCAIKQRWQTGGLGAELGWRCGFLPFCCHTAVKKNEVCGSIFSSRMIVKSSLAEQPIAQLPGRHPHFIVLKALHRLPPHPLLQVQQREERTTQTISTILFSLILTPSIPVTPPCQSYGSKISSLLASATAYSRPPSSLV